MATEVRVELGERSYPIRIQAGILGEVGSWCGDLGLTGACLVVTDANVDVHYGERCVDTLARAGLDAGKVVIPAGETSKSLECLSSLYDAAIAQGLDRHSFVVALGGGVVGDLAGYLAASFLRGVAFVQVPTTIVAMVDSAVGGKTGINLPQGKNLVGSFWQPSAVLVDLETLATLPDREFRSGLAEVVKYGVIWDEELFNLLEKESEALLARDAGLLRQIVARSCEIKAEVVRQDEREGGLRAILNFGHTVGHAIEKVATYGTYLHGEAISVGMVYAAKLSEEMRSFSHMDVTRLTMLLHRLGLPVAATDCEWSALRQAIGVDKKTVGKKPRFVLADRLGSVEFGCEVDDVQLEKIWHGLGE